MQRHFGLGKIGNLDLQQTQKLTKTIERRVHDIKYIRPEFDMSGPSCSTSISEEVISEKDVNCKTSSSSAPEKDGDDGDFGTLVKLPWQSRIKLKSTALASDRYGVSDRATAAIASSLLQDIGIVTNEDFSQVVDKNKVRKEKERNRTELQTEIKHEALKGLYFDGRKDKTLMMEKLHAKYFRRAKKEEHYSLIQEPGSLYIGHVSPSSGSSNDIASSIISYLSTHNIPLDELDVIGCDGTVTNTGWKSGVIRLIELHIKRPLQWGVCLLHFNELPLRHMFISLDGVTTGPKSLSGPIGAQLSDCEKQAVVNFENIHCVIPDIDRHVLSKDQKYLLDISTAIKSGNCPDDLAVRDPGPLSHLTTNGKQNSKIIPECSKADKKT